METLADPESLRDDDEVPFHEQTRVVDPDAFEAVRDNEDHVAVGVTNEEGAVLLVDDGAHGWTLAAFPVGEGDDWAAVGRRGVETLTGVEVGLEDVERVRRIEFRCAGDEERTVTTYTVVVRAGSVDGRPLSTDPRVDGEPLADVGWFDDAPERREGPVDDDIRLFVG